MKSADVRPMKQGRGPGLTIQGAARDCAKAILYHAGTTGVRRLYNMSYFGAAMRNHVKLIKEEGLSVRPEIQRLVDRAEEVLKAECDGKDCSFVEIKG